MSEYLSKISSRGDIYILQKMGARTDPCGTPFDISRGLIKCDSILIE